MNQSQPIGAFIPEEYEKAATAVGRRRLAKEDRVDRTCWNCGGEFIPNGPAVWQCGDFGWWYCPHCEDDCGGGYPEYSEGEAA